MIDALEKLSRTRALTLAESVRLERCLRSEGLIPPQDHSGKACAYGHEIEGDNAIFHNGKQSCRECYHASSQRSYKAGRDKLRAIREANA